MEDNDPLHSKPKVPRRSRSGRQRQASMPLDAMSVALSEASSHVSQSWNCHHCGYRNSNASQELCALCGIKETKHTEDYRQAMQRKRAPGDVGSYRWFDSSGHRIDDNNQESNQDRNGANGNPPVTVIMAKKKAPPVEDDNSQHGKQFQHPMPLSLTTAPTASFAERSQESNRVPTPKNSSHGSSNNNKNKTGDDISVGGLPPLLNRTFQDDVTSPPPKPKRPPLSPKSKVPEKASSVRSLAPRDQQWVSFSEESLGEVSAVDMGNCEGPSSTMAVKSGKGNGFFEAATTCEESVSKMSYSSRSTVKVSNITNHKKVFKTKINRKPKSPLKSATSTPMRFQSPEIDIGSLEAPSHSKSTPTGSKQHGDIPKEDTEQSSTLCRGPLFMPEKEAAKKSTMSSLAAKFVPPARLYHTVGSDSDSPVSTYPRLGELSLANSPHLPSVSSLASSTTSSQFHPSLAASVQAENLLEASGKGSTTDSTSLSMVDYESQSIMMDERDEEDEVGEGQKRRNCKTRSIRTLWLVVCMSIVGVAVALAVALGSSNSSSSKFETSFGNTLTPTDAPIMSPLPGNNAAAPGVPVRPDLGPIVDGPSTEPHDGSDARHRIEQIASERGTAVEALGVSVAVGSHRLAMMGNGFVRVKELVEIPSSTAILTWPRPPSEATERRYSQKLLPIGNDINFTVTHESPQMALSENGERLALVIDSGLFVYEYSYSDNQWERIFTSHISDSRDPKNYAFSSANHTLATSVSISDDGAFVAAGIIMPLTDDAGNTLVVNVWDMIAENETILEFKEPLDKGEATAHDYLNVQLSNDGEVLAACTRVGALVGKLDSMELESLAPSGHAFDACGISGDGATFALSSRSTSTTIIYEHNDFEWDPQYVLPASGTSVSLDLTGNLVAVGGNHGLTMWVESEDDGPFEQIITFSGQPEEGGSSAKVSVALSKAPKGNSEQFMVVGQNESVVIYKVVAPNE